MPLTREGALRALLTALLDDIRAGMPIEPSDSYRDYLTVAPWRGLKSVLVRYDSVAFEIEHRKAVEARVSRLPTDLADLVRVIWLEASRESRHAQAAFEHLTRDEHGVLEPWPMWKERQP